MNYNKNSKAKAVVTYQEQNCWPIKICNTHKAEGLQFQD